MTTRWRRSAAALTTLVAALVGAVALHAVLPAGADGRRLARVGLDGGGTQPLAGTRLPAITPDGRFVAFLARTDPGDRTVPASDAVMVRDRLTSSTDVVSALPLDDAVIKVIGSRPAISADGRYVAWVARVSAGPFSSVGFTRQVVLVTDRVARSQSIASAAAGWTIDGADNPSISTDGRYVGFDATGGVDVVTGGLVTGPVGPRFTQTTPTRPFVIDRGTPGPDGFPTALPDQAAVQIYGPGFEPALSGDGRHLAYRTNATTSAASEMQPLGATPELDANEAVTDIVAVDRLTRVVHLVSRTSAGRSGNDLSASPSISTDGTRVAFASRASDLVAGDRNDRVDVFVLDRDTDGDRVLDESGGWTMRRASVGTAPANAEGGEVPSDRLEPTPSLSPDGSVVAFATAVPLLPGDGNGGTGGALGCPNGTDVYLRTIDSGALERVSITDAGREVRDACSGTPAVAFAGAAVAFATTSPTLLRPDANDAVPDVLVSTPVAAPPPPPPTLATTSTTTTRPVLGRSITAQPAVARPGRVTIVSGQGFPANAPVTVRWSGGAGSAAVTTDGAGRFTTPLLVLGSEPLGPRDVVAQSGTATPVTTPFLVEADTGQPPRFTGR